VSKHSTIGMLKCQNDEMQKTPFGVECGHCQWSCEREDLTLR
jgi:hypothetical protein